MIDEHTDIIHHVFDSHTAAEYFRYLVILPAGMIGFDLSGIPTRIKRWLFNMKYRPKVKFETFTLKPLDCAACLSFWIVILLSNGHVLIALAAYAISYL